MRSPPSSKLASLRAGALSEEGGAGLAAALAGVALSPGAADGGGARVDAAALTGALRRVAPAGVASVPERDLRALLAALPFHQFFEGVALGACFNEVSRRASALRYGLGFAVL